MKKNIRGFTLVEILIVIALLSVMAFPVMGNYLTTQKRARDAVRKHDISEIGNALEEYYGVCGTYSYPSGSYATLLGVGGSISCAAGTFMSKVPQDPKSGSFYCSGTCDTTQYTICGTLEAETAPAPTGFCLSNRQ